ncbi:hypothetical protein SUT328_11480 [Streptococcus parasuis]|nr:hypothetical protein SUT380_11390 [Streptococcus parasuis]GIC30648.1 hypothetical protein SUT328_11480 [Streptococcus parasuis]
MRDNFCLAWIFSHSGRFDDCLGFARYFSRKNYRIRLSITKEFHHEENTIQITTFKYSGFGGFGY